MAARSGGSLVSSDIAFQEGSSQAPLAHHSLILILIVKTATEVGVRAIQDHKVIEWNTCWKCRLSEGTDDK